MNSETWIIIHVALFACNKSKGGEREEKEDRGRLPWLGSAAGGLVSCDGRSTWGVGGGAGLLVVIKKVVALTKRGKKDAGNKKQG